jgi:single-strand DNA-binding protein
MSDSVEVKGIVNDVRPVWQSDKSDFKKRELIVETEDKWPQLICIEFINDKIELLDDVQNGDSVTVHCNLRGRKWTTDKGDDRYNVSLSAWRMEREPASYVTAPPPETDPNADNLPF